MSIILEVLLNPSPDIAQCLLRLLLEQRRGRFLNALLTAQGGIEGEVFFRSGIVNTLNRWFWNDCVHSIPLVRVRSPFQNVN